jgi:CubicO group peptidase (beta-lactamase class C family)
MNKIKELSARFLLDNDPDAISIGVIDFKKKSFKSTELFKKDNAIHELTPPKIFYDLASVSKVLINGIAFLDDPKKVDLNLELLLNHRAGLPAYGMLSKSKWKDELNEFEVSESQTEYSDYSALRFMLEYEEKNKVSLKDLVSKYWGKEVYFWKDLPSESIVLQNGYRDRKVNAGVVHDPRAFLIDDFVSHAGLFATIHGVCETLLNLDEKLNLLDVIKSLIKKDGFKNRFIGGWDRVEDPSKSLAGLGCSKYSFGHLGFTGTSVWIDPELERGHVILTNATKHYWYDKKDLNELRKRVGQIVWEKE